MRTTFTLILLAWFASVAGKTYYVAPNGNDATGNGSISNPWASFNKAHSAVISGDTVFFRGGVYYISGRVELSKDGTYSDPICFFNYPGESPIIDGSKVIPTSYNYGIYLVVANNWILKGIKVRNIPQASGYQACGIMNHTCRNIKFINCTVQNVEGHGFQAYNSDSTFYFNCDSHHNVDSLHYNPGNTSDGFNSWPGLENTGYYTYYYGCRSWSNGDDGWDMDNVGLVEVVNCWAWDMGKLNGDGNGFKLTTWPVGSSHDYDPLARRFINCVAIYNRVHGFHENDAYSINNMQIYNCSTYRNGGWGFQINTNGTQYPDNKNIYRNNLAYNDDTGDCNDVYNKSTHDHNNWDLSVTVTDEDFLSLDTTGISATRQPDGSLPDNICFSNFMRLTGGSDLIDKGAIVGLSYSGSAPDLGAFEYLSNNQSFKLVSSITITGAGGSTQINQDNGTLQLAATVLPSDATNRTVNWAVVNGTGRASISSTGLVTAIANGSVTVRATANDGSGVIGTLVITLYNQIIPVTSITVTGAGGSTQITQDKGTLQLAATVMPSDATNRTVTWAIVNGTGQASISTTGLVTAVANGIVTAKATASDGSEISGSMLISISNQATIVNQPPLVSISSPTKSSAYISPATVTIDAIASDPDGFINKVEFYNGGVKLGEKTSLPYSFTWKEVPEGIYNLTAVATDNNNARTTSAAVSIIVEKTTISVNQLPVVRITSPGDNKKAKKHDKIIIEAVASDPDGSISKVEFKSGGSILAEITAAPYIYLWEAIDTGKYTISVTATDNLGAISASQDLALIVTSFYDVNSQLIKLYPNPNNGQFAFDLLTDLPGKSNKVTIVSITGSIVYYAELSQEQHYMEIDLSTNASGSYILMITSDNAIVAAEKIIKQ